jgi:hypothetical protein
VRISTDHAADSWANGRRLPDPARAANEFEAFLVAEVWKQSQQGPRWSKLLGEGSASSMTQAMWLDEVVQRAIATRGLGLAQQLERAAEAGAAAKTPEEAS